MILDHPRSLLDLGYDLLWDNISSWRWFL